MSDTHIKRYAGRRPPQFELIAGAVCLDFVNTLDDRFTDHPKELLESYLDLGRFAEDTQIVSTEDVDRLFAASQEFPQRARSSLETAIKMREAMHQIFWAIVQKRPVPSPALLILNQCIRAAAQHVEIVPANGRFEWTFEKVRDYDAPLWPIAKSAADLLASDELGLIRACAADTCQWLFLDTSKNHHRRWCDMKLCGNRAKFRRFYNRQKESDATARKGSAR